VAGCCMIPMAVREQEAGRGAQKAGKPSFLLKVHNKQASGPSPSCQMHSLGYNHCSWFEHAPRPDEQKGGAQTVWRPGRHPLVRFPLERKACNTQRTKYERRMAH